jgi:predicted ABC-type ATPase
MIKKRTKRIDNLLEKGVDFAFETTLVIGRYVNTVKKIKENGYLVFWIH